MGTVLETAAAPAVGAGAWSGEFELAYERDRQEIRNPADSDLNIDVDRFHQRLDIRNNGFFLLDPRFLSGSLGLDLDVFQEQQSTDGTEESRDGRLRGYQFDAGVLTATPYSGRVFANRNENIVTREFGGRSEFAFENRGATFLLREDSILRDKGVYYFSSTLGARQERTQEKTVVLDQRIERDEQRNIVTFDANKGFQTADLKLRLEITDAEDNLFPQRTFRSEVGNLDFSMDFGPGLNRRWDSRVYYFNRTQNTPLTLITVDENLRIDHHQDFFTGYRYLLSRQEATTGETASQTGTFRAHQRHYGNLTSDYFLLGQQEDLPNGERTKGAGEADFNYRRTFSPGRRVFARFGGRYQLDENDLTSDRIDVIDEPHTAPSPLNIGFLLNNPFVVASTIVVVDVTQGNVTTTLGVDYDIVAEGDFTRIIPLSTSAIIQAGDALVVSYTFEVASRIEFSTVSWWISGGADFQWIAFSYAHERSDQNLLAGEDNQFLDDRRLDTAQVELRGNWQAVDGRANLTYSKLDSELLSYSRWQLSEFVSYRPRFDLMVRLNADNTYTNFTLPERETDTQSVRVTLDWFTPGGWRVSGFVGTRKFVDDLTPTEKFRDAGVKARRTYGRLEIAPSLIWSDRERGPVENTETRFELRAIRRF
jgi:hypothetical protein